MFLECSNHQTTSLALFVSFFKIEDIVTSAVLRSRGNAKTQQVVVLLFALTGGILRPLVEVAVCLCCMMRFVV